MPQVKYTVEDLKHFLRVQIQLAEQRAQRMEKGDTSRWVPAIRDDIARYLMLINILEVYASMSGLTSVVATVSSAEEEVRETLREERGQ